MKLKYNSNRKEELEFINKNVKKSYEYFYKNNKRAKEAKKFWGYTNLTPEIISQLRLLNKPPVELNMGPAYLNRQKGEFMILDPSYVVRAKDDINLTDPRIIDVTEAHFRSVFGDPDTRQVSYNTFSEMLDGGFSVVEIYPEYVNQTSTKMRICVENVFSSHLCGFDPLARKSHKGDGRFCFKIHPMAEEDAIDEFGSSILNGKSFIRTGSEDRVGSVEGIFNWSYTTQTEKIIMVVEFYGKKYKKGKILKLSNGYDVSEEEYEEKILPMFEMIADAQAPKVVGKPRKTDIETIVKYVACENEIHEKENTDFAYFPLVFFDGNSSIIAIDDANTDMQVTKPYLFHARDCQILRNLAAQSLAHEIEMVLQSKFIAPMEGIPDKEEYQAAYIKPQIGTTVLYNAFHDNNPDKPIPAPREINRIPIPPELLQTLGATQEYMQGILGSYDAAIGMDKNYISNRTLQTASMNSNAASKPYIKGFIDGWNRIAQIYLDLLPKYYVTPRTIPIIDKEGKRSYYRINEGDNVSFNYESNALDVVVEAGVNFEVQKQMSLNMLSQLSQSYPALATLINKYGLEVILDNVDIRGIDKLKAVLPKFLQEIQQQEQAAGQKKSPEEMLVEAENNKTMQKAKEAEMKSQVDMTQIKAKYEIDSQQVQVQSAKIAVTQANEKQKNDIEFIKVMNQIQSEKENLSIQQEKIDAENARTAVESAIKTSADIRAHQKHNLDLRNVDLGIENMEEAIDNE